jgi:hypothetical protein
MMNKKSVIVMALVAIFSISIVAVLQQQPQAYGVLCNDPNWDEEGTCIDPSTPKCTENTDEICYNDDGELENVGCGDAGRRDGRNGEFDRQVFGDNLWIPYKC